MFPMYLTSDQIRVLIEGMKLVRSNPATAAEHDMAGRLMGRFEQLLQAVADDRTAGRMWSGASGGDAHTQCRFCGEFVRDNGAADTHECSGKK